MRAATTLALIRHLTAHKIVVPKKRVGRWPAPVHPDAIGLAYTGAIVRRVCEPAREAIDRIVGQLVTLLVERRRSMGKMDAANPVKRRAKVGKASAEKDARKAKAKAAEVDRELRTASEQGKRAAALIDGAARQFTAEFYPRALHDVVEQFGKATDRHSRLQLDQQLRTAIGVPLSAIEKPFRDQLTTWAATNVDLIVTLPSRYFDDIRERVNDAFEAGTHPATLADDIQEAYGNSEWEAERIARDQTLSLASDLNQERMTALGVTDYVWRTVNDGRVRDNHEELNGQRFSFDDPPMGGGTSADEPGNPGDGILCRCYADPVLDDLING